MTPAANTKAQHLAVALIFCVGLLADQAIKLWVKTHMALHQSIRITDWFCITYIENDGMAMGMDFINKYLLTSFRIVATVLVGWYIWRLIRRGVGWGYLVCMALIMTGAAGNIIDCVFYGLIFDQPAAGHVAHFVPFGEGYATWFRGRVVDMFYFPLFDFPQWMPLVGGTTFFSYIFNLADACITTSVVALLLFCRDTLSSEMGGNKRLEVRD